jgi:hypothetical protein
MSPSSLAPSVLLTLFLTAAAQAQPGITVLPSTSQPLVFPIDLSDDGSIALGYQDPAYQWIWRRETGLITGLPGTGSAAMTSDGSTIAGEQYTFWNGRDRNTPITLNAQTLDSSLIAPVTGWRGCDDDVANIQDISGDGRFIAALVWGDPACPNPSPTTGSCCITTGAIYDTQTLTWQLLPKTAANISAKASKLSRDGSIAIGWNNNSQRRGSVWTATGQTLLSTPLGNVGEAYAVSDNGRFVVGAGTTVSLRNIYLWKSTDPANAAQDLGQPPTSINAGGTVVPAAISNNGRRILGFRGQGIARDAWIWESSTAQFIKLYDHLINLGLIDGTEPYSRITIAPAMTPDGRFIAAQGADFGGTYYPLIIDLGPQACNGADMGSEGGADVPDYMLDNNDFVVFIDRFFSANPAADLGGEGGSIGSDSSFDNNDFIVFIQYFFEGC